MTKYKVKNLNKNKTTTSTVVQNEFLNTKALSFHIPQYKSQNI